ncbi:unnamed protein product, partial [Prorocentrum cordatum]
MPARWPSNVPLPLEATPRGTPWLPGSAAPRRRWLLLLAPPRRRRTERLPAATSQERLRARPLPVRLPAPPPCWPSRTARIAPLADGGAPAPGRLLRGATQPIVTDGLEVPSTALRRGTGTPGGGEGASCTLRRGEEARRLPWRPRSLSSDQPQEAPAARGEAAEPAPPASAPGRAGGGYFTGDDPAPEEEPFPARRLALLAFGCLALLATGHATGAVEKLDAEHIGSMAR